MELWLTGGSHYSAHQGTKWIPTLFRRLSRNKMQVTAQGLRHRTLSFLTCWGLWRVSTKCKMNRGRGSLATKFWSCRDLTWLHRRGSRELKVALVILILDSYCFLYPHYMDVTSVEEVQWMSFHHCLACLDDLGHPSGGGVEQRTMTSYSSLFLSQTWEILWPFSWVLIGTSLSAQSHNRMLFVCYSFSCCGSCWE